MEIATYKYHLTLSLEQYADGRPGLGKNLEIDFEHYQELFRLIDTLNQRNPFSNEEQLATFIIGLKMFSEVMIKNLNHPLFEELSAAYRPFMMKLKRL